MDRNTTSHFDFAPMAVDTMPKRSRFSRPARIKTTFNAGDLVPLLVDEVLPGDTFTVNLSSAVRMSTPLFPVMDNAYIDTYAFFIPNRLVWEHWREFCGENRLTAWEQPMQYTIPQITAPQGGWQSGTIADHFGLPTDVDGISVSSLPFRALCLVWNEWFRDQNLKDAAYFPTGDATQSGSNGTDYVTDACNGGMPLKVAKFRDYFTSALPEPQKGPDVLLPLGGTSGHIPVAALTTKTIDSDLTNGSMTFRQDFVDGTGTQGYYNLDVGINTDGVAGSFKDAQITLGAASSGGLDNLSKTLSPNNLFAITDRANSDASTINQLRQAFAIQRMFEKDARGGTRYREILRSHFGVNSPDASLQVPEYLGGHRTPISMDQVAQTSETSGTPLGSTGAYSLTNQHEGLFTKSFTEHGILLIVGCVRTDHSYQQGIERFWSRQTRFDFYWPELANIGEQAILNKEIYATGTSSDDEVFGYQEAFAEYRYKADIVSGQFRSNYAQSLDSWHYADDYASQPILGSAWIDETRANIDRTLAVPSQTADQFFGDFLFDMTCVRPMPLYSIPGLAGHM